MFESAEMFSKHFLCYDFCLKVKCEVSLRFKAIFLNYRGTMVIETG